MDLPDFESAVNNLYIKVLEDKEWFLDSLMSYTTFEKSRLINREISTSTLRNIHKPMKLFCDMNDILINWRLIKRGLPPDRRYGNDRIPTIEEIHKLLEYTDVRIRPIVLVMVSSGIRLGAWSYLKWKHIIPIVKDQTLISAKVIVYAGEVEQYFTFCTPEAYFALKSWMDFRVSYGEVISGESWLMRDVWNTISSSYGSKVGLAKYPKKLDHRSIRSMINRALHKQGLRNGLLEKGVRSHEFKAVHGFRKFFKTVCEGGGMKPANVELLLGHDIGISSSYYKPTENQLLEDYIKIVNLLTVDKAFKLQEKLLQSQKQTDEYKRQIEDFASLKSRLAEVERLLNSKPD